jgi:hypothetical protein
MCTFDTCGLDSFEAAAREMPTTHRALLLVINRRADALTAKYMSARSAHNWTLLHRELFITNGALVAHCKRHLLAVIDSLDSLDSLDTLDSEREMGGQRERGGVTARNHIPHTRRWGHHRNHIPQHTHSNMFFRDTLIFRFNNSHTKE